VHGSGQPRQRQCVDRSSTTVDAGRGRALAGQPLDHVEHALLHGMRGLQVPLERPSVLRAREKHAGVLARTVHEDGLLRGPGANELLASGRVGGRGRRTAQRGLGNAGPGEQAANQRNVSCRPAVACRGDCGVFTAKGDARGHDRDRLQRLQAGPRKDRRGHIPEFAGERTVRAQDDRRAGMT
jgi:hypothetical protein